MLIKNNNETILNKYIDYLKDKSKIIQIKDTSQNLDIKLSNEILFYFLSIISIALVVLTIYLINISFINPSADGENNTVIIIGISLFTAMVIGVTLNEKKHLRLNISYPNENQIKVNTKIFDIKKEACYIDIEKKFESYRDFDNTREIEHHVKYFLTIRGNKSLKSFQITNGTEEELKDFIYNLEYEISDFKMKKSDFIKNAQNSLEDLYDKGIVSQDTLNKLYKNKDK